MEMFDLAIVGGGPAGYAAAERAGAAGLKVVLFEERELGGVCLNEGCMPTKTLLYSAKVLDMAAAGAKYGVATGDVGADVAKIFERKKRVVRRLVAGVAAKMKAHGVQVVKSRATILGRDGDVFSLNCEGSVYRAAKLLICTGSRAFVPPIPGLAEAGDRVVTAREILSTESLPGSLVVIGGGVIGMEFASFYNSLGVRVAVVEMLDEILGGMDGEIAAMLREAYAKRGVEFFTGCRVTAIDPRGVVFTDRDGVQRGVEGEKILVSVGRRALTEGFGLETLGVELERGGIKVDERMRTSVPGVYAAGDVTGFSMLAHTAVREGEVAVSDITGGGERMSYRAVPGVVYTSPEVASAGLTAAQAAAQGIAHRELKLPMAYAGRFVAENEGGTGLCKVVVSQADGLVLGVHMIGNPASEIIYGACVAIEAGMNAQQLRGVIFPHPTVSEILRETLFTI